MKNECRVSTKDPSDNMSFSCIDMTPKIMEYRI